MGYITRFKDILLDDLYDLYLESKEELEWLINDLHDAIDEIAEQYSIERWS